MIQSNVRMLVKVSTTDGKETVHQYPLPGDQNARNAIIDDVLQRTNRFQYRNGIIPLQNPVTVYNITKVVKIEWEVVGSSTEAAQVEERIVGLNITR